MLNVNKLPMKVKHSGLVRLNRKSGYKSNCPVCVEGVLPMRRDTKNFQLEKEDRCLGCGQRVIYLDIDTLRKKEKK
jgi:uncharacterized protein (DUF983 family)